MPFAVGETIGAYRIMEQLGQGGMATVYKAYHASLDRYVALKVLHPAFHEDQSFTARFQREARVVAKLEHPSIVPIYDYAEYEKRPYLVMKYIEGETLKSRLARGPLSSDEINRVVDAVGSALGYAHKQGILHRDIKPSNVLISTDGHMYLADFGLARIAQAGESTLSSDSIMGTPQYISPEQARGDKNLDAGTDIYSFGVMLYEMVVGQVPFSADTPFSIIHDHIYSPLPMPRAINPEVPESVERVLLKALAKDPADRYADVPAMVKAFKEAWSSAGVPMQGTAITLPKRVSTHKRETVKKHTPVAKTRIAVEPKKKRSPWPVVAAGVLFALCCFFVFLAIRDNRGKLLANLFSRPTATKELLAPTPKVTRPEAPNTQGPDAQLPPELPPEVLAAQQKVDQHPDDPFAKLDLALAYWQAGMQRQAYETLNDAANQASESRPDFFLEAGNRFKEKEAWIAASAMYLRVIKLDRAHGKEPSPKLATDFHEAVYKSSDQADIETYLRFEEITRVDQPIGLVAQARHAYSIGKLDEGHVLLARAKHLDPNFLEATLLDAEFAITEQRYGEAKLILTPISADLGVPEWIRFMADDFLNQIP